MGSWCRSALGLTDAQSREFVTWALVKAAATGHHVVALHRQYAAVPPKDPRRVSASLFLLSKELVAMLAVDEGFCNLKQIVLKLKNYQGCSTTCKVQLSEAKSFSASMLIVGIHQNSHAFGSSSISVPKVPSDCSVFVLSQGKIVFH